MNPEIRIFRQPPTIKPGPSTDFSWFWGQLKTARKERGKWSQYKQDSMRREVESMGKSQRKAEMGPLKDGKILFDDPAFRLIDRVNNPRRYSIVSRAKTLDNEVKMAEKLAKLNPIGERIAVLEQRA